MDTLIIERWRRAESERATAGLNAIPLVAMLMSMPSASSVCNIGIARGFVSDSP
jgi:hypothetical protein